MEEVLKSLKGFLSKASKAPELSRNGKHYTISGNRADSASRRYSCFIWISAHPFQQ